MAKGELGRQYHDGEIIVRQGEVGNCMYVVQSGEVEVIRDDGQEYLLRVLGAGEMIGEMSLFDREVRSATVRARGEARLLTIEQETLLRRIDEDPTLALNVIRTLSRRVRELSDALARSHSTP
jgi:CRP-like cAMP-binding protein